MPLDRNQKGRDKWIRESKLPNGGLTCGMRGQILLNKFSQMVLGEGRERETKEKKKKKLERERESTFSLDFSVIGPSNLDETRSKVGLRGKGYEWIPVLWSFNNSGR